MRSGAPGSVPFCPARGSFQNERLVPQTPRRSLLVINSGSGDWVDCTTTLSLPKLAKRRRKTAVLEGPRWKGTMGVVARGAHSSDFKLAAPFEAEIIGAADMSAFRCRSPAVPH